MTTPKVFGWILKSPTLTSYPWLRVRPSEAQGAMSGFTSYIGDARVFKRLKTAQQWPDLEPVPVYFDPRKFGERATIKPLTCEDVSTIAMTCGNEKKFDKIV